MRKAIDLTGRVFGRLTVLGDDPRRKGYVLCQCQCGNQTSIRRSHLTRKNGSGTVSCGCLRREIASENGKKYLYNNSFKLKDTNRRYNTNFPKIETKRPQKNNTSGHSGVSFYRRRSKYVAYINLHGKRIYLGCYSNFEDAVKARQSAEEELFAPIIAARQAEVMA